MPPRKKAKATSSTPITNEDDVATASLTPRVTKTKELAKTEYDILKDPWTDEQESSLFKGLMRWKPNGMHKHFRMIALSEHLRNHGYDPRVETHTRIPGIWQKLGTLYNMRVIDDRENSFEYEEDIKDRYHEFELPPEDYDAITFMRGKFENSSDAGSSPPRLGQSPSPQATHVTRKRKRGDTLVNVKTRASTVEDTDEARTSPTHSPPGKVTRSGRNTTRSAGQVAAESTSRPQSRETTIEEEIGEGEEEEAEEGVEGDEQETEEDGSKSPKTSKATSRSKADPPAIRKSRRKR